MKRVIILVASLLLVFGSIFNAQPRNGNRIMDGKGSNYWQKGDYRLMGNGTRFESMQSRLGLTDEQTSKISDLRFEHEKMALEARNEIQTHRLIVRKMMADNEIDQDKLLKISSENSKLQEKIKTSRTKMWLEVYNLLDDAQKEKFTANFGALNENGRFFTKNNNRSGKRLNRTR